MVTGVSYYWEGGVNMAIVFRASGLGHPCIRKLWYEAVRRLEEPHSAKTMLTFKIGTVLEAVAVEFLQPPWDTWEVRHNSGSQEAEIETVIPVCSNVEIRGHHDIVLRCGENGEWIMGDIKTMNGFAFKQWKKFGTESKYPQYLDQLTIYSSGEYARSLSIRKMAVIALCKDSVDFPLPVDVVDYNEKRLDNLREKAFYISSQTDAPDPGELPSWCCNYCGFQGDPCLYRP
jgi:hypothetical protein